MQDVFEAIVLCEGCNEKTIKDQLVKDGFEIRFWECPKCNKQWYHPADMEEYKNFEKIKNKRYEVKLRYIGNSYAISIPREIIDFEEEMQKELSEMIQLSLEEPEKLSIYFTKRIKRFIKQVHEEEEEE